MESLTERFGPDIRIFGPPDPSDRGGVLSFAYRDLHPHDISQILDEYGVCVRAGHHCAKPLMRRLGVNATARASLALYNDESDVDRLADALAAAGAFSGATATLAIQSYLDALQHRDTEAIARGALCGIYDAVRDRRSDQAVAKLSSDAFRKQFSEARVTSIDKIVYWSDYQAQVLFSMRVQPADGSSARSEVQGVAQLLSQHNQIVVCSYVLRTAGFY